MNTESIDFLKKIISIPGPSGGETAVSKVWRKEAETFADHVHVDVSGSSLAVLDGGKLKVLLAGHIDEIGVMISYIEEHGFLSFLMVGHFDEEILVGQRIKLEGKNGIIYGVVGRKDTEFMDSEEAKEPIEIKDLWIDIGAKNKKEALEHVRIGSVGVIDVPIYNLLNNRIVSRALDDRVGAFAILESLKRLSAARPSVSVAAAATTQEEISSWGAKTSTFSYKPDAAIIVDVAYSTDPPESDKKAYGEVSLGSGPVISPGSANSPVLYKKLLDIAEKEKIPYTIQVMPVYTFTDADAIHSSRSGVASALISIPSRYMHSPNEMVELNDIENTIKLIVAFVKSLENDTDFIPT